MGASVISHGNPAPVVEFCEHVLDFVAFLVGGLAPVHRVFPVFPWRNTAFDFEGLQRRPKGGAVIAFVPDQGLCRRQDR